jgi:hypothetical protein
VYVPTSMLMALHEDQVRGLDQRAFRADPPSSEPGWARSSRARPWPARALAAVSGRSRIGARRAGLVAARADS